MRILVFNAGSSSLKLGVFDAAETATERLSACFERFGEGGCVLRFDGPDGAGREAADPTDVESAIAAVSELLARHGLDGIDAVGHRIAHGGARFDAPAVLDARTMAAIEALTPLAPLHNPANLHAVRLSQRMWPDLPQIGVFDTAFHLTNPPRATTYAIPRDWREAGVRRYGFHGTSHAYVAERAAEAVGAPLDALRMVSFHLGNGASVCAIQRGASIDSSMGLTPLEGLVMGTRSGDVDPGIYGFLNRELGLGIEAIERALNTESGLRGLTGLTDMRDVSARAAEGDADCELALQIYAYRARKYLGAYAAAMGGLDVVVFTGGVGENDAAMRARICKWMGFMGLRLDATRNGAVQLGGRTAPQVQADGSPVRVVVTTTAEELMIARETAAALA